MTIALIASPANWAVERDGYALAAIERFDRHEALMQAALLDAIGGWLDEVREALPEHLVADAAPAGAPLPAGMVQVGTEVLPAFDLADADSVVARVLRMADRFVTHLERDVVPVYNRMLDEVLGRATHDGRLGASLLNWRSEWLDARRQELVKVPDTITGVMRTALGALARRQGTSVDDAEDLVQTMLDRGYPQWTARARTIARTEVVGANNQGSLASWQQLADAAGVPAVKTWLATEDSRTRKHHRDLDGTTVPLDGEFVVGRAHMNGPGDNHGPPEEVINCRCTLTYSLADDVETGDHDTFAHHEVRTAERKADQAQADLSEAHDDATRAHNAEQQATQTEARCGSCSLRASGAVLSNRDLFARIAAQKPAAATCCQVRADVKDAAAEQTQAATENLAAKSDEAVEATAKAKNYKVVVIDDRFVKVPLDHEAPPVSASVTKLADHLQAKPVAARDAMRALADSPATTATSRATIENAVRMVEDDPGKFMATDRYYAMRPDAEWSAAKRDVITAALGQDENGKLLADVLDRFQDGGSIARLRTNVEKYVSGQEMNATSRAKAEALVRAIRDAPTDWAPDTAYRGMTVKGNVDTVLARYTAGDGMDLSLTSFTTDRNVAKRFQYMTETGKGAETKVMVELIGDGKRMIPIQNFARDRRLFKEKEWVSAGRYEVVEAKKSGGGVLLRIKQVGTIDPPAPPALVAAAAGEGRLVFDDVIGGTFALDATMEQRMSDSDELTAAAPAQVQQAITSGVAIMLGLGAGDEAAILAGPSVPEPEAPGLHCTVGYLADNVTAYTDEQKAALIAALGALKPEGTAEAFATATFNPDSDEREPCAVLLVQSQWLADFHATLADTLAQQMLDTSTTFPIWVPHIGVYYGLRAETGDDSAARPPDDGEAAGGMPAGGGLPTVAAHAVEGSTVDRGDVAATHVRDSVPSGGGDEAGSADLAVGGRAPHMPYAAVSAAGSRGRGDAGRTQSASRRVAATDALLDSRHAVREAQSPRMGSVSPMPARNRPTTTGKARTKRSGMAKQRGGSGVDCGGAASLLAASGSESASSSGSASTTITEVLTHLQQFCGREVQFNRLVLGWGDEQIVVAGEGAVATAPGGVDGSEQTDPEDLTAAVGDTVTAPPAPLTDEAPAVTESPAPNDQAEATGGDTGVVDLTPQGPTWQGPIAKLDAASSDGRIISSTGGTIRTLPLPLSYQREGSHGGQQAGTTVRVGRILSAEVQGDVLYATGDWDMDGYDTADARGQVDDGMGMVSVDLALQAIGYATEDQPAALIDPALVDAGTDVCEVAVEWELGGVTLVQFPAFDGIRITNDPIEDEETMVHEIMPPGDGAFAAAAPQPPAIADDGQSLTFPDGTTVAVGDPVAYTDADGRATGVLASIDAEAQTASITPDSGDEAAGPIVAALTDLLPMNADSTDDTETGDAAMTLLASSEVRPYTSAFFAERDLTGPTPLTVNPQTGEVYGHLATWNEPHAGKLMEGKTVYAPHSKRDYGDFHLSPVLMDDGALVDVGRITVGTGHAKPGGGYMGALDHYDNTGTQVAVVRAYEDKFGLQLTGQLIHDTPSARVEELMRSPLSGDWRVRDGNLELCAALAVNAPGFPVRRLAPVVGQTDGGRQLSLVAACMVEAAPRVASRSVTLPSGATIEAGDFDALVAAAADAIQRGRSPRVGATTSETEALAMRRARARLALA